MQYKDRQQTDNRSYDCQWTDNNIINM